MKSPLLTTILLLFGSAFTSSAQQLQQQQQSCPQTRERKSWNDLTCAEQDEYLASIRRLKDNGLYDEFVRVHIRWDAQSHGTPEFLPWHRWFIFQFESALRTVSTNPCITLPYWDWETDSGRESRSSIFHEQTFGAFVGGNRQTGSCNWPTVGSGGGCLERDMDPSFRFWTQSRIVGIISRYRRYADRFTQDPERNNGFRAALEAGPHSVPHNMIGGNMVDRTSPNDPIFYLHHANVDRVWATWQDYHDHTAITAYSAPEHYEGRLLNDPMPFGNSGGRWDFRYQGSFPTPQQILSNAGPAVRVRYIQNQMVPGRNPNRRWFSSRTGLGTGCRRGRRNLVPSDFEFVDENISIANYTEARDAPSIGSSKFSARQQFLRRHPNHERVDNPSNHWSNPDIGQDRQDEFVEGMQQDDWSDDESDENITPLCRQLNTFRTAMERTRWNELCNDYVLSHNLQEATLFPQVDTSDNIMLSNATTVFPTMAIDNTVLREMVETVSTAMALAECDAIGNPSSGTVHWMTHMQLSNERVAFDCFHVPDEEDEG